MLGARQFPWGFTPRFPSDILISDKAQSHLIFFLNLLFKNEILSIMKLHTDFYFV